MIRLEDWALVTSSPYAPPEMGCHLLGAVYGHPDRADGTYIMTSATVKWEVESQGVRSQVDWGNYSGPLFVTTESGTVYQLGTINREYAEWRERQGMRPL